MNHHLEAEQHLRELLKEKQGRIDALESRINWLEFDLKLRNMNVNSLEKELEKLGKTVDNNICSTLSCMH